MNCSEIIALIDVIITSILTGVIIWQTYKLHKSQQKLEEKFDKHQSELQEKINQSQIEMQQRQLKLDVYEYRREVYLGLNKVFKYADSLNNLLNVLDLTVLEPKEFAIILEKERNVSIGANSNILELLAEAKHIFNSEIYEKIHNIKCMYSVLQNSFFIINFNDKKSEKEFAKTIMDVDINHIREICENKDDLIKLLDEELDVSNLEK